MTKIITLYNNMGGVFKTTTLFNLAAYLSKKGKRVLIADCDPQCNATELFFASSEFGGDPSLELPGTSIYKTLQPRFSGKAGQIDPKKVELVESNIYKNLFILRGDFEFSMVESNFANSWDLAITENMFEKNTYVVLYRLLHGLGDIHKFDYILCDVGSSTSAITRMVVLSCDGFFMPLTLDRFSNQAVHVLGRVLEGWIKKHKLISNTFEPFLLKSFPGNPVFLGGIIQDFMIQNIPSHKWELKIQESLKTTFFSEDICRIREGLNSDYPFVARIRDTSTLGAIAQMFGCAIFDVRREYTAEASSTGSAFIGVALVNWEKRKKEYLEEIKKIAEALP
jgi:cellulose biosynthesis protein BcsQ